MVKGQQPNITISDEILDLYSDDDDVPEEIMALTKYSDDVAAADSEQVGNVVEDDDAEAVPVPAKSFAPGVSGKYKVIELLFVKANLLGKRESLMLMKI